ncbi:hypothetical protein V6259_18845 [Marinomonas sp. TI.3.20]|uniref:hypothetical protein n=1 Tax=Marinomonas sp. TI.3.20 TaxID=3121296 RepID=UPI00311E5B92
MWGLADAHCETNITFMSLSGDAQPHYTSIAHFVTNMKDQIEPLFTQVLMICDREGLIGRNMFAIDGCCSCFKGLVQTRVKNGVVRLKSLSENKPSYAEPVNAYLNAINHKTVWVKMKSLMILSKKKNLIKVQKKSRST